jgi:Kef-type K+ transport system membrane component KefB
MGYCLGMQNLRIAIWLVAYLVSIPIFFGTYGLSFKLFAAEFGVWSLLLIAPAHVVIWLTLLSMLDRRRHRSL